MEQRYQRSLKSQRKPAQQRVQVHHQEGERDNGLRGVASVGRDPRRRVTRLAAAEHPFDWYSRPFIVARLVALSSARTLLRPAQRRAAETDTSRRYVRGFSFVPSSTAWQLSMTASVISCHSAISTYESRTFGLRWANKAFAAALA